jgi:hypothetical protein
LPVGEYFRKFIDSIISFVGQDNKDNGAGGNAVSVEDIS